MTDVESSVPIPEGAVPYATVLVVGYIDLDGEQKYAIKTSGDSPMTTFNGLLFEVMLQVHEWGAGRG